MHTGTSFDNCNSEFIGVSLIAYISVIHGVVHSVDDKSRINPNDSVIYIIQCPERYTVVMVM